MGDVRFQVSISVAGDTKATIEAADETTAKDAITLFAQRFAATTRPTAPAAPTPVQQIQAAFAPSGATQQQAPICGVHGTAMVWVNKHGGFWSCHKKNSDGSWCSYKPTV